MTPKEIVKIAINLVVIYVLGGLLLAFVYAKTSPIMFIKAKEEKEAALKTMMPDADKIEEIGKWEPHHKHAGYYVAKKDNEDIGYIVESFGKGYSSYINMLVAVDKNFTVKKINILHHAETPGLGDEIEKDYFLSRFAGKTVDTLVVIKGDTADKVEAISGATISSRAVTEDGVRNGVKMLTEKLSGGGEEKKEEQGKEQEHGSH
ncbi:MAG: RnfABCDGE type electron transport complex subunit G [Nitrospirae bacterium]|nr:RnfABCDGE type electron transport complex subunit G [Nitrospirota bacterium]